MHCTHCIKISHFVNVAKCARDQCSISSTVQQFCFYWSYLLKSPILVLTLAIVGLAQTHLLTRRLAADIALLHTKYLAPQFGLPRMT